MKPRANRSTVPDRMAWLVLALACLVPAGTAAQGEDDLDQLTLEELMSVPVTTVSRSPELAANVPAAIAVITADDIRRSGATSLAEVLRQAPGMQVARVDAGKWAIGTRGFADRLSRSLLVLIDGRAVYSPLFAGTYWETQHVMLEDIERIEVIRGPGGTLWGSNAVNGIINVITRSSRDTQGGLVSAAAGTEAHHGSLRYGRAVGGSTWLRGYVSGFDHEAQHATGPVEYDAWRLGQVGFRMDSDLAGGRTLMIQGAAYDARLGEWVVRTSLAPPYRDAGPVDLPLRGGSFLARWTTPLNTDDELELQTWYELTDREEYPLSETRHTVDVDLQLRHYGLPRQEIVWGAAYRWSWADLTSAPTSSLPDGSEALLSVFAQDEISFASDQVRVTLGAKLEHNRYSGLEVQPTARLAWLVSPTNTFWAAATRAIRRPSRVERLYATMSILDPTAPAFIRLSPNADFRPEKLWAYETGYRVRPHERLYVTVSGFYNVWHDLISTELLAAPFQETVPPAPTRTIFPVGFGNSIDGESAGVETTIDVRPTGWWRAAGHYAFLSVWMTPEPGSADLTQESRYEDGSPRHQVSLRNSLDLPRNVTLDWHLRYASELPDLDISSYATSDVRLAWRFTEEAELEAVGRNLHDAHHAEWAGENGGADVEIQRSLYVGLSWRW